VTDSSQTSYYYHAGTSTRSSPGARQCGVARRERRSDNLASTVDCTSTADQTGGATTIAASATALPVTRIMTMTGDLAFGRVRAGTTATRTLTISNRGNDALDLFGISFPTGFTATGFGAIAPGGTVAYVRPVRFASAHSGAAPGRAAAVVRPIQQHAVSQFQ